MPNQGFSPRPDPNHEPIQGPFNAIPPLVLALVLVLGGIEAVLSLADTGLLGGPTGIGWRITAIGDWGVSPAVLDRVLTGGGSDPWILSRFLTYVFVHASATHALFGVALLAALGKFVGEVMHPLGLLTLITGSAVGGALAFGVLIGPNLPLIGIYPVVYGLIGGFTYLMWMQLGQAGSSRYGAFRLIGALLAIQLVFGLLFGGDPSWVADLAGFIVGFALSPLLAPGGWRGFVARMRRR